MAKFARKGSVSSSSKKSAAHNLVPLDKFLSTSRNKSDDTGHRDHDASSINVAHSHLPAAATEGNSIDTQEVYSCNLFEVSEDIENKVDREHQRRGTRKLPVNLKIYNTENTVFILLIEEFSFLMGLKLCSKGRILELFSEVFVVVSNFFR